MKRLRRPVQARAWVVCALSVLGGCNLRPVAPPPPSPEEICKGINETLAAAVPPGESQADLQVRGIRVRTPLNFPPGTEPRPAVPSGAAVQLMIQPDGSVAAGSPRTLKAVGEPQIASAMEAGALSMSFDFDAAAKPSAPVPFTTTYAVCIRS